MWHSLHCTHIWSARYIIYIYYIVYTVYIYIWHICFHHQNQALEFGFLLGAYTFCQIRRKNIWRDPAEAEDAAGPAFLCDSKYVATSPAQSLPQPIRRLKINRHLSAWRKCLKDSSGSESTWVDMRLWHVWPMASTHGLGWSFHSAQAIWTVGWRIATRTSPRDHLTHLESKRGGWT